MDPSRSGVQSGPPAPQEKPAYNAGELIAMSGIPLGSDSNARPETVEPEVIDGEFEVINEDDSTGSQDGGNGNGNSGSEPPNADDDEGKKPNIPEKIWKWFAGRIKFTMFLIFLYGAFFLIDLYLKDKAIPLYFIERSLPIAPIWEALVLVYTIAGVFNKITAPEIAAKLLLGKPIQDMEAGWAFVPPWLCELALLPGDIKALEIGTKPDITVKSASGTQTLIIETEAQVIRVTDEPMRVTSASEDEAENYEHWWYDPGLTDLDGPPQPKPNKEKIGGPLGRTLTSDPLFVLRIQIGSPSAFLKRMGTLENGLSQIARVVMGAMQLYYGRRTQAFMRSNSRDIEEFVLFEVEKLIGDPDVKKRAKDRGVRIGKLDESWGVDVKGAQRTSMGFPKTLNIEMRNAASAEYTRDTVTIAAEGEQVRLTKVGQGEAAAIRAKGEAQADAEHALYTAQAQGIREVMDETGLPPSEILAARTAAQIAPNLGNVFVSNGEGLAHLVGSLASAKGSLDGSPSSRPPKNRRDSGKPPQAPRREPPPQGGGGGKPKPGPKQPPQGPPPKKGA